MEDISLTAEEVRGSIDKDLTDEQVETIRDFLALSAVITYEDYSKRCKDGSLCKEKE